MELEAYQIFGFFPRGCSREFPGGVLLAVFFLQKGEKCKCSIRFFLGGSSRFEQGGALPLNFRYESSLGMNGAEIH